MAGNGRRKYEALANHGGENNEEKSAIILSRLMASEMAMAMNVCNNI